MLFREQSFACISGATCVLPKLSSPKLENLMGCLESQSWNAHSSIWWVHRRTRGWWYLLRRNWSRLEFHDIWWGRSRRIRYPWCRVVGWRSKSFNQMPSKIKAYSWKTRKTWMTWCTCCGSRFWCWWLLICKLLIIVII